MAMHYIAKFDDLGSRASVAKTVHSHHYLQAIKESAIHPRSIRQCLIHAPLVLQEHVAGQDAGWAPGVAAAPLQSEARQAAWDLQLLCPGQRGHQQGVLEVSDQIVKGVPPSFAQMELQGSKWLWPGVPSPGRADAQHTLPLARPSWRFQCTREECVSAQNRLCSSTVAAF